MILWRRMYPSNSQQWQQSRFAFEICNVMCIYEVWEEEVEAPGVILMGRQGWELVELTDVCLQELPLWLLGRTLGL